MTYEKPNLGPDFYVCPPCSLLAADHGCSVMSLAEFEVTGD